MNFNKEKYGELLSATIPAVIETPEENTRILEITANLIRRGENRSPEETRLCGLLTALVQEYETRKYSRKPIEPHIYLQTLLEEREMRQKDLLPIFGAEANISDTVKGKRAISKNKARQLGEFFNVDYRNFL